MAHKDKGFRMKAAANKGSVPGVEKPVSRIVFGTAIKPMLAGQDASELLDAAFAHGIDAFDCARGYGDAEKSLGAWIRKRDNREDVVVVTKCGNVGPFGRVRVDASVIKKELAQSLRELQTDYADIFLLHRDDPKTPISELVEALNEEKAAGRIRCFGASNWTHGRIQEANAYAEAHGLEGLSVSSPNFSLALQAKDPWGGGCVSISGEQGAAARAWYADRGMPILAYSSLGRSFMSGRFRSFDYAGARRALDGPARKGYLCEENMERLRRAEELAERDGCSVSDIAIRHVFGCGLNLFAILSSTDPRRIEANVRAAALPLTPKDAAYLEMGESL